MRMIHQDGYLQKVSKSEGLSFPVGYEVFLTHSYVLEISDVWMLAGGLFGSSAEQVW